MLAYTPLDEKSLALLLSYLQDFLKWVSRFHLGSRPEFISCVSMTLFRKIKAIFLTLVVIFQVWSSLTIIIFNQKTFSDKSAFQCRLLSRMVVIGFFLWSVAKNIPSPPRSNYNIDMDACGNPISWVKNLSFTFETFIKSSRFHFQFFIAAYLMFLYWGGFNFGSFSSQSRYLVKNSASLFNTNDYEVAPPEYHRKAV